jgi:hypothetical protein
MAILQSFTNHAFDSDRFSFHDTTFVAEASDFNGDVSLQRQIYDDACDVGIAIRSKKTGKVMHFYLHDTVMDREGDIQCWEYLSCPEDVRKYNQELKVTIFND